MLSLHFPRSRGVPACDAAVVGVHCTHLGALRVAPSVNLVKDTDELYVDSVPTRAVEVQYGRGGELFGWHALGGWGSLFGRYAPDGTVNIPMPGPGTWTLQVRFATGWGADRIVLFPIYTYTLEVTGE
jgi:hypothetical protein